MAMLVYNDLAGDIAQLISALEGTWRLLERGGFDPGVGIQCFCRWRREGWPGSCESFSARGEGRRADFLLKPAVRRHHALLHCLLHLHNWLARGVGS